ncbi:hypothetical protein K466DRAFT_322118 [Polyporus arcularius HHB13444]|uniref:F-box domain-containing protein n=1 Tax=Polyporus arcularius HHB13444 TaxID=1314778 RepID=A0A5C3P0M6_9APHY|nr:hypothetical protein K466DRAFT_322118 [Polyporus arcularius HHB13444]
MYGRIARLSDWDRDVELETYLELRHLGTIILGMHLSAESLSLPVTSIPLAAMSKLSWPRLRDLELAGHDLTESHVRDLQRFLARLGGLRSISIHVSQLPEHAQTSLWGSRPSSIVDTRRLESLSVAHPDSDDAIFSRPIPSLLRLALRYHPRRYLPEIGHFGEDRMESPHRSCRLPNACVS